jgi:hypothetical protein
MKIVTRKTLMGMPSGIIYSDYKPCFMSGMSVKWDSWPSDTGLGDFVCQCLEDPIFHHGEHETTDILSRALETGESIETSFDFAGREGLFDDSMLYAVWERSDVEKLVALLQTTLATGYSQ